ncbi:MAG: apolipoprotein N-acyltransferase [Alphaproteobacteria bacterium]
MMKISPSLSGQNLTLTLLVCFIIGGLGALAMAPTNFWILLLPCLGYLYVLLTGATPSRALLYGWFFCFGYFVMGLLWISNALLVDGNPFVWMLPIAVAGLPALLSCFMGLGAFCAVRFSNVKILPGFLALCAWLAFFEWLRSFVFTGFPWNSFGYTWASIPQIVQSLSFSNIYVLNWLTILWLVFPAFYTYGQSSKRQKIITGAVLYSIFIAFFIYGTWRLDHAGDAVLENAQVKIIQGNIPQSEKWKAEKMWEHFTLQANMSLPDEKTDTGKTTYIIWPETALSHWVLKDPNAMQFLTQALSQYRAPAYIMSGLLQKNDDESYSNSFATIDKTGQLSNIYSKHHLVPFGEYIPFQKYIPLKPVAEFAGFKLGGGPATLHTPEGLKYSPVICYEIIFSGQLTGKDKPDVIINITNDSWYGVSPGPHQHFAQALFRAVEEGIPVIRAASTGISGIIDPYGRIRAESTLFEKNTQVGDIPARLDISPRKNFIITLIFLVLFGFFTIFGARQKAPD